MILISLRIQILYVKKKERIVINRELHRCPVCGTHHVVRKKRDASKEDKKVKQLYSDKKEEKTDDLRLEI